MTKDESAYSRQSFLGKRSQEQIESAVIGISGLGGGGSHVAQQLAHLGCLRYVLFDGDTIELSNLNRLIGGTLRDVEQKTDKVEIARRRILEIRPHADVRVCRGKWQEHLESLKACDIVFGCVDGFDQRRQLEAMCRRYLIPLIDIGMDVVRAPSGALGIAGQVILSMPGAACMHCLGFLNEQNLAREAGQYGAAGANPQVVWTNGVLASTAVGLAVDLLTDWSASLRGPVYLSLQGATGCLQPHQRLQHAPPTCTHYPVRDAGPAVFLKL